MQPKFIPVDFAKQTLACTLEHALHLLIVDEVDLSLFSRALRDAPGRARKAGPVCS